MSLVTFIAPLISLVGNFSPELVKKVLPNHALAQPVLDKDGKPVPPKADTKTAPFNVRYGGYTLFRLISYCCSEAITKSKADKTSAEYKGLTALQTSLVATMWTQLSDLIALRATVESEDKNFGTYSAQISQQLFFFARSYLSSARVCGESLCVASKEASLTHELTGLDRADVAYFANRHRAEGFNLNSSVKPALPSAAECNLMINQFLWILRRCCSSGESANTVRRLLAADPNWVSFLLAAASLDVPLNATANNKSVMNTFALSRLSSEPITRVLVVALLRDVLPHVAMAPAQQKAMLERVLDLIGESTVLPLESCLPKPAYSPPRSELIYLYRSLLGLSLGGATPEAREEAKNKRDAEHFKTEEKGVAADEAAEKKKRAEPAHLNSWKEAANAVLSEAIKTVTQISEAMEKPKVEEPKGRLPTPLTDCLCL
jgi:hypothetical protein